MKIYFRKWRCSRNTLFLMLIDVSLFLPYTFGIQIFDEVAEMFVYKFDILQALKDAGYNTARMRKEKLLGENAIQSLRKGEMVGIIALDKICGLLKVQPGDIIAYQEEIH